MSVQRLCQPVGVLLLLALPVFAGEPQVIDDFEFGTHGWYLVEGTKPGGAGPLCVMTPHRDAKVGRGCARLQYQACPNTWTHMQLNVDPLEWVGSDCDRVAFWVKGDGSGEKFNLMFGNYEIKPSLCFIYPVTLDFTEWRRFVVSCNDFTPKGQFQAALGRIVLAQLNVSGTKKPVDLLIDDLVALPAERGGQPGRFFDLDVVPAGGWETPAPSQPATVDNMRGVPPGITLSRYVHGLRNHRDLHNPVQFAVDYPEAGTFAVKVTETSGYGGSRLLLTVDGEERLRRDFPGETETVLTQYQGYYAIEIPPGKHVIKADNDGNDWIVVQAYRFGNYSTAGVKVRRENASVTVTLLERNGSPLRGTLVEGNVAGEPLRFTRDGATFVSEALLGRCPYGLYPVTVTAKRAKELLFTTQRQVRVASPRLVPRRLVFPVGQPVEFLARYSDEADAPADGQKLTFRLVEPGRPTEVARAGLQSPTPRLMENVGEGAYCVKLSDLPAGVYEARIAVAGARTYSVKFMVYDPHGSPWIRDGIIRLGKNGRFVTQDDRPHMPWGYATIGLFLPDPEVVSPVPGQWGWCRASDEAVLAWIGLLRSYGINCLRFGLTVDAKNIGGDRGGHADPFIVERLRHFLDLIGPLGVRALPVLWWGHYRNFGFQGISAYDELIEKQADWFTNPKALELQKQYVREMVTPFRGDPRIFAWEVMNETYRAGSDLAAAVRWTNDIIGTIRSVDPNHLITTSACEATPAPETEWMRTANIDFFNYHAYPTYLDYGEYRKWAGDAIREMGNYAAMMALADRLGNRVNILGETGNDRGREVDYPEFRALITRDCLWLAFLCGSPGGISWDAIADPREFDVISRLADRINWNTLVPAVAPVAVRVADLNAELGNLARYSWWSLQSGVPVEFVPADAAPAKGQGAVPASTFQSPPAPQPPLTISPGFQSRYLMSQDRRVFIAYVRNVGEILPQNVRTRTPRNLALRLSGFNGRSLEVWDLDARALVKTVVTTSVAMNVNLGETRHDFALFATT